ncbi:MAG: A/G-specific adenine glycosylase [Lachnospiraceae bacterium]|nr:A/G-specific adenine glycosylase [Lachnospiraceae bacterium]
MKYENIYKGQFLSRPNRFIAYVDIDGHEEKVHVKNTGRCRELLTDHAEVYLDKSDNLSRSTAFDLVAVRKGNRIINMDSQAPNRAVEEWLRQGGLFTDVQTVRPETKYENSRFDFYVETEKDKIFIEVKGVTLEKDDVVLFPDAPSQRAVKHVKELSEAIKQGYKAYILLVVQMEGVKYFTPNRETQPEFADALLEARQAGVEVLAYDCLVTEDTMRINQPVEVRLSVLDEIAEPLLKWYDSGRRLLPWREDPSPYHVWVSEIMLQQTRVEAVKPYYDRFMQALPDIEHLAVAEEENLLKLWEGLGYYNRVRNLNKAAKIIMKEYHGNMPSEYEQLVKLPGIGSYTAGAVSSIAYGQRVPAVDGNVLRVLTRLCCDERDIMQQSVRRQIEQELRPVIPERAGDFNQALMELGATVCVPNGAPHCADCPWREICRAHKRGEELCFPHKTPPKPRTIEEKTILIIRDGRRTALQKRDSSGLLAGMYEFPSLDGKLSARQVLSFLKREGLSVLKIEELKESRHIFSHKEWHMIGYMVRVDELAPQIGNEKLLFVEKDEAKEKYPIPSAYSAYMEFFL